MDARTDVGNAAENFAILGSKCLKPTQDYVLCREVKEAKWTTASGLELITSTSMDDRHAIKDCKEAEVIAVGPGVYFNTGSPDQPGITYKNVPQCRPGNHVIVWWKDVFVVELTPMEKYWLVAASSVLAVIEDIEGGAA